VGELGVKVSGVSGAAGVVYAIDDTGAVYTGCIPQNPWATHNLWQDQYAFDYASTYDGAKNGVPMGNISWAWNDPQFRFDFSGSQVFVTKARGTHTIGNRDDNFLYSSSAHHAFPQSSRSQVDRADVNFRPMTLNSEGLVLGTNAQGYLLYGSGKATQITLTSSAADEFGFAGINSINHNNVKKTDASGTLIDVDSPVMVGYFQDYDTGEYRARIWKQDALTNQYVAEDLNNYIGENSDWTLRGAIDINDKGWITGWADHKTGPNQFDYGRPVLLIPAELMVDGNRDGQMSFTDPDVHDADGTSADKPYRFWLNNDHDIYHVVDGNDNDWDDASDGGNDSSYTSIYTTRDLEDFTRLRVTFKGLTDLVKNPENTIYLEWRSMKGEQPLPASDGVPEINVYQERQADIRPLYVEDDTAAMHQLETPFDSWIGGVRADQPMDLFAIRPALRAGLSEAAPTLNLLFCGKGAGRGQLTVTIKKGNQVVGQLPPVFLELLDIKDMYERWSVGDANGGEPEVLAQLSRRAMPTGYISATHSRPFAFSRDDPEEQNYILYVHGWNVKPEEKDQFAETAYKRLFWQGYKGRFGTFQWPTTNAFGAYLADDTAFKNWIDGAIAATTDPTNYDRGEWAAWRSGLGLKRLLLRLNHTYPGQIYMFAHSMGNIVAAEALRMAAEEHLGVVVNTYVASQAAVPVHCYDGTRGDDLVAIAPVSGTTLPTGGFLYPETPNIYKDWSRGNGGAASQRVNFFNTNDYALWNDCWQLNQYLKPDQPDDPDQQFTYQYTGTNYSLIENKFAKLNGTSITTGLNLGTPTGVQDRYEIMAFAAESRSKALGGENDVVLEKAPVDLQTIWSVDAPDDGPKGSSGQNYGAHKWHSAEFRSTNMRQRGYWRAILDQRGFGILSSQ
jgi:hypothetical protein